MISKMLAGLLSATMRFNAEFSLCDELGKETQAYNDHAGQRLSMERPKLAFLALGFYLGGLLSGCGSSNQAPPPPPPPPPPPLAIVSTSVPNGGPSVFYSVTLDATGGSVPYSWTITQ